MVKLVTFGFSTKENVSLTLTELSLHSTLSFGNVGGGG
jgi:hypothetical protein